MRTSRVTGRPQPVLPRVPRVELAARTSQLLQTALAPPPSTLLPDKRLWIAASDMHCCCCCCCAAVTHKVHGAQQRIVRCHTAEVPLRIRNQALCKVKDSTGSSKPPGQLQRTEHINCTCQANGTAHWLPSSPSAAAAAARCSDSPVAGKLGGAAAAALAGCVWIVPSAYHAVHVLSICSA